MSQPPPRPSADPPGMARTSEPSLTVHHAEVIQVGETASRMAAAVPAYPAVASVEEVLPSTLEYKQLGDNWSTIQQQQQQPAPPQAAAAPPPPATQPPLPQRDLPADIPSTLEYKDQGQNLSYFIPRPTAVPAAQQHSNHTDHATAPTQRSTSSNRQGSGGGWSRQTTLLVGLVMVLTLAVGVLVGVLVAGKDDGDGGGNVGGDREPENVTVPTTSPTPAPVPQAFDWVGITMNLQGGEQLSSAAIASFETSLATYYTSLYEEEITEFANTVAVTDQNVSSQGNVLTYDLSVSFVARPGQEATRSEVRRYAEKPFETAEGREEFWNMLIQAHPSFIMVTQVDQPVMPAIIGTIDPTRTPSPPPIAIFPTLFPNQTSTPTMAPVMATSIPTMDPTNVNVTVVLTANITGISLDADNLRYVVDFTTNFNPLINGGPDAHHVHFFFDTVGVLNAGTPGTGPWILYDVPSPFTGYQTIDRPAGATQLCITPAKNNHAVVDTSVFHCATLPTPVTNAPTTGPTPAPVAAPTSRPSLRPTRAPTLTPTLQPTSRPSLAPNSGEPAPVAPPPGVLTATITNITVANGAYQVFYTSNFDPVINGGFNAHHLHFYFDTVGVENAGRPGAGPWILYDTPSPFTGYGPNDRPAGATQMCVTPATNAHEVDNTDYFHCIDLP